MKTLILSLLISTPLIAAPVNRRPLNVQNQLKKMTVQLSSLKRELKSLQKELKGMKCFTQEGGSWVLRSDQSILLQAATGVTIESSATTNIKGALIRLNNGNRPAAGVGDIVIMQPTGAASPIQGGSTTVFID